MHYNLMLQWKAVLNAFCTCSAFKYAKIFIDKKV